MSHTIAFFKDRKGFEKRLNLAGAPPPYYRFSVLPKIKFTGVDDGQVQNNSLVEFVEFILKQDERVCENVWEAHYEEA